jgi:starch phosphorylase
VLHIVALYNRLKQNPGLDMVPRTFIFGGKAAPGYTMAKLIIKLINSVAEVINRDPDIRGRIKVVFVPNYSVKVAQRVYPAANLSEQISTAGKEASGTGNMKFSMNGALTIGTLDGANVEIRAALDLIGSGLFSHGDRDLFRPLVEKLIQQDEYLALADFPAYAECQNLAGDAYRDVKRWTRMSILNVARMGKFSSDRTIAEYCRDIWRVQPVPIELKL